MLSVAYFKQVEKVASPFDLLLWLPNGPRIAKREGGEGGGDQKISIGTAQSLS